RDAEDVAQHARPDDSVRDVVAVDVSGQPLVEVEERAAGMPDGVLQEQEVARNVHARATKHSRHVTGFVVRKFRSSWLCLYFTPHLALMTLQSSPAYSVLSPNACTMPRFSKFDVRPSAWLGTLSPDAQR